MGNIGFNELLIILVIVFLLFGAKKIPELAAGLGKGLKEFKKAQSEPVTPPEVTDKKTATPTDTTEKKA